MKTLDRYLVRELLAPILTCAISLIVLILIADIFDNLDVFLRYNTPPAIYLRYYASLIPFAYVQTIHWSVWLGTLFLLVNLGVHNELIAMKSAGLKISTIAQPILFLGCLVGILTFLVNDRVVPATFRTATELREIYIDKQKEVAAEKTLANITYQTGGSQVYYFRTLTPVSGKVTDAVILWMDKTTGRAYQKVTAKKGIWKNTAWEFEGITEHQIDARGRILGEPKIYARKMYPDASASPKDLTNATRESIFLTYREMKQIRDKLEASGVNVQAENLNLQTRLAAPWQSLVMILMTLPFLAKTHNRRSIAAAVLTCVALAFAYHVFGAICLALGHSGKIPAFVSAWLAHILFAGGALLYMDRGNY
ncbi:MAG: LptF/LptG family permease [Candidatus Omnitrophica bacterium]|nr:LptF/LptG family permease [Candidatus Omnitrophota bacterium]